MTAAGGFLFIPRYLLFVFALSLHVKLFFCLCPLRTLHILFIVVVYPIDHIGHFLVHPPNETGYVCGE